MALKDFRLKLYGLPDCTCKQTVPESDSDSSSDTNVPTKKNVGERRSSVTFLDDCEPDQCDTEQQINDCPVHGPKNTAPKKVGNTRTTCSCSTLKTIPSAKYSSVDLECICESQTCPQKKRRASNACCPTDSRSGTRKTTSAQSRKTGSTDYGPCNCPEGASISPERRLKRSASCTCSGGSSKQKKSNISSVDQCNCPSKAKLLQPRKRRSGSCTCPFDPSSPYASNDICPECPTHKTRLLHLSSKPSASMDSNRIAGQTEDGSGVLHAYSYDKRSVHASTSVPSCTQVQSYAQTKNPCEFVPCSRCPTPSEYKSRLKYENEQLVKQDPVVSAMLACEAELRPIREALLTVQTKLRNLNMPELDCILNNSKRGSGKDTSLQNFKCTPCGTPRMKPCGKVNKPAKSRSKIDPSTTCSPCQMKGGNVRFQKVQGTILKPPYPKSYAFPMFQYMRPLDFDPYAGTKSHLSFTSKSALTDPGHLDYFNSKSRDFSLDIFNSKYPTVLSKTRFNVKPENFTLGNRNSYPDTSYSSDAMKKVKSLGYTSDSVYDSADDRTDTEFDTDSRPYTARTSQPSSCSIGLISGLPHSSGRSTSRKSDNTRPSTSQCPFLEAMKSFINVDDKKKGKDLKEGFENMHVKLRIRPSTKNTGKSRDKL